MIVENFQLVKEAKRLAAMGLPSFHEKKPTQKELEVVEHINFLREEIQRYLVRQSEDIQSRVVGIELNYKSLQSDALNAEFERQTRKLMDEEEAAELKWQQPLTVREIEDGMEVVGIDEELLPDWGKYFGEESDITPPLLRITNDKRIYPRLKVVI